MPKSPRQPDREEIRVELSLGDAWWELGDPWAKATYRVADSGLEGRQALMKGDLVGALHDGAFDAVGYMISPKISNVREIIPKYLFEEPEIDWEKSILRAYGHVYEGVRVVAARYVSRPVAETVIEAVVPTFIDWDAHRQPAIKPKRRRVRDEERQPVVEENIFGPLSRPRSEVANQLKPEAAGKRGRKPLVDKVQVVIRQLKAEGQLDDDVSQKELEHRIQDLARELYPDDFRKSTQPVRNTIYKAMAAEGLRRRS